MFLLLIIGIFITSIMFLLGLYLYEILRKQPTLKGKHVVITGGSSGIGKSIGISAVQRGAHVTIIARDSTRLEEAKQEIALSAADSSQKIRTISLDISKNYEDVERTLKSCEEDSGPVYMLVNCAGTAVCGRLEDTSSEDIQKLIASNLLGTLYVTKALISKMKSHGQGSIVITGSQCSLLGIYGYTLYSSTKFALRGFAEALQMEVKPYGLSVTLAVPPDTDTPGFANEEKSKPLETRLISQTGGLFDPSVVGEQILEDALSGKFFSYVGFESMLTCLVCAGMAPISSVLQLITEVLVMGLLRLVSAGYLLHFDSIIQKCKKDKNQNKKVE